MTLRVPRAGGDISLTFQSRHLDKGLEEPIPGDLWVEARALAATLEQAVTVSGNAAATVTPIISLATNASVGELDPELAFESTPGLFERQFFQIFVPGERGLISRGRIVNIDHVRALLAAIEGHPERDRLLRATAQYHQSLKYWRLGHEILATAHLYMGVEALTKAVLRSNFGREQMTDEQIAARLGLDPNPRDPCRRLSTEIDAAVRSNLIFQGDADCYRSAKAASDGFEHGYMPFDELRDKAKEVRDRTATYLRQAILQLLPIAPDLRDSITDPSRFQPLGDRPLVKYLRGRLTAKSDNLASDKNEYPIMTWRTKITSAQVNDKGEYLLKFEEKITPQLADGVSFQPASVEVWAP